MCEMSFNVFCAKCKQPASSSDDEPIWFAENSLKWCRASELCLSRAICIACQCVEYGREGGMGRLPGTGASTAAAAASRQRRGSPSRTTIIGSRVAATRPQSSDNCAAFDEGAVMRCDAADIGKAKRTRLRGLATVGLGRFVFLFFSL